MTLDDVIFTLFRHQWLILGFACLGIAGAAAVRVLRPPLYISEAKLMVHSISEGVSATPTGTDAPNVQRLDPGVEASIKSEIEILTSFDVARMAAEKIGPEKILARKGGGSNLLAAAGMICSGIEVETPRGTILKVSFKHPDKDLVQPMLDALIQTYMDKHVEVHLKNNAVLVTLKHQQEELSKKLAERDEQLKKLQAEANVLFPDDLKQSYQTQITQAQKDLMDAERDLAEHKAVIGDLGGLGPGGTNGAAKPIPPEKLAEYGDLITDLDGLKKDLRTLTKTMGYGLEHPAVLRTKAEMERDSEQKKKLEETFPALKYMTLGLGSSTNSVGDVKADLDEIRRLTARVAVRGAYLSNLQAQAVRVMEKEPKFAELKRQRDEDERNYLDVTHRIEQCQINETAISSKAPNMSPVESPTPPKLDTKKLIKQIGIVLAGCLGLGLGLAFGIDHFLDRSIKRRVEIERYLHLPVFLSIPDTTWTRGLRLARHGKTNLPMKADQNGTADWEAALVPWSARNPLQAYAEGLRERILTFFEVRNLNLKKPKLVGVAGCERGSGVSTLAGGLAAELSKTGSGNVLLVDMNANQGSARTFHKGKPGCGLADILESDNRAEAQIEENFFVASIREESNDKLMKVMPAQFTSLMPKLKTSDYDYIIFDMPPVSPTSSTPRLAGHMDLCLLVLEAEKTGQHKAERATALMHESQATVAAVLNKYRQHVPAALAQD
jgi:uncharacterized protein involved in exopolysaccharide biosynthesis/Mrp family chromosome partitioning ATPase